MPTTSPSLILGKDKRQFVVALDDAAIPISEMYTRTTLKAPILPQVYLLGSLRAFPMLFGVFQISSNIPSTALASSIRGQKTAT